MTATAALGGNPGTNRDDGTRLAFDEHIAQSLRDIATTPIGSRIQRRDYGSYLFALIDSAMNPAGRLRLTAAFVDAACKWEPRITITDAQLRATADGKVTLTYSYRINRSGESRAAATLTI